MINHWLQEKNRKKHETYQRVIKYLQDNFQTNYWNILFKQSTDPDRVYVYGTDATLYGAVVYVNAQWYFFEV